jgi:hypothetical protein
MNHVLAASCTHGSWAQKWSCGWHQPPAAAAQHAGYFFGHAIMPWLIGLAIVLVIIIRGRRGHRAAMNPSTVRK